MAVANDQLVRVQAAVSRARLLDTAIRLVNAPSPTGDAGAAADRMAEILTADGFHVERRAAGHAKAPAVVVRFDSGKPGRTLQFNGHLDVVHLPYSPAKVVDGNLTGSGSCDMKGGTAAAVEALRAIRDIGLSAGSILFTAHDLHEAPWGLGEQLDQLIRDGIHGDAVLLPEPLSDHVPTVGRGSATWKIRLRRSGPPIHEVMRPMNEPSVIAAGAELVGEYKSIHERLSQKSDPQAGPESLFIGQIHSGEIFNQYPQECWLEGTRRWLPDSDPAKVKADFVDHLEKFAQARGVEAILEYKLIRNAFRLDLNHPIVSAFRSCQEAVSGRAIPLGPKPFVDDGNSFWRLANVPTITHGPRGGGQHTVNEWVEIDDLVRVAQVYALTALNYTPI